MAFEQKKPEELTLDRTNPRFGLHNAADEEEALEILRKHGNLRELWSSISERGFEKFEPLIVIEEEGNLVVIEGNRRLAAVKLLIDAADGNQSNPRRIPLLSKEKLDSCRLLPILIVEDRSAAAGYIGFKHVNGPSRWSPIAKAKFGVNFYEAGDTSLSASDRMKSLVNQLGDSRGLILRLLVAYKVVIQARDHGIFDSLDVDENDIEFSHLYTLINSPGSRAFLGLTEAPLNERLVIDDPIPISHLHQLGEVMDWLYGPNSVIRSQGTDRPRLQKVLASEAGVAELRISSDLDTAESVAGIKNQDWLKNLARIVLDTKALSSNASSVVGHLVPADLDQAREFANRLKTHSAQLSVAIPPSNIESAGRAVDD